MSSACEAVNMNGFISPLNRVRKELNRDTWYEYHRGQFCKHEPTGRICRIQRFVDAGGVPCADIRFWYDDPSAYCKAFLFQVELLSQLTQTGDPRDEV